MLNKKHFCQNKQKNMLEVSTVINKACFLAAGLFEEANGFLKNLHMLGT